MSPHPSHRWRETGHGVACCNCGIPKTHVAANALCAALMAVDEQSSLDTVIMARQIAIDRLRQTPPGSRGRAFLSRKVRRLTLLQLEKELA